MKKKKEPVSLLLWGKRLLIYVLGLYLMAIGVVFSSRSSLGVSPVSSLGNVIFQIGSAAGAPAFVNLGNCTTGVFCLYLIAELLILRRDFKPVKLLKDCPVWQAPEAGAVNLFLDYFDGVRSFKANNVLSVDACDQAGSKHRWKNTLHGDTENVIVWDESVVADFTSNGYRIYAATLEGPYDVVRDGKSIREL